MIDRWTDGQTEAFTTSLSLKRGDDNDDFLVGKSVLS